jgi:hypothetical protein
LSPLDSCSQPSLPSPAILEAMHADPEKRKLRLPGENDRPTLQLSLHDGDAQRCEVS